MITSDQIESALRPVTPPDLQGKIAELAVVLADAANRRLEPGATENRLAADPDVARLLQALAGKTRELEEGPPAQAPGGSGPPGARPEGGVTIDQSRKVIDFGSGNQLGSITIRDVAETIVQVTVTLPPAADALDAAGVRRRWREWAGTVSLAPVVEESAAGVSSPLLTYWEDFIAAPAWHEVVCERSRELEDRLAALPQGGETPPVQQFREAVGRVNWQANYTRILRDLSSPRKELHGFLNREIQALDKVKRLDTARQKRLDALRDCRTASSNLDNCLNPPRFGRCFLVAGSYGSGKTHFLDALLRRPRPEEAPAGDASAGDWILVPVRPEDYAVTLERTILHVVELATGLKAANLAEVDQSLAPAGLRLVVGLDDLQDLLHAHEGLRRELRHLIEDQTRLPSLYWLLTLNDTGYDAVTFDSSFWEQYGFASPEVSDPASGHLLAHSGWLFLDALNRSKEIGLKLLAKNQLPGSDLALRFRQSREVAARHIHAPLLALIALTLHRRDPRRSLLGLNYIDFINEFWGQRVASSGLVGPDLDRVQQAITAIARLVTTLGDFTLPRPEVLKSVAGTADAAAEVVDRLHRMSLLKQQRLPAGLPDGGPWPGQQVTLQFELFWSHHLAWELEQALKELGVRIRELRREVGVRFRPLRGSALREAVAEQLLLLADALASRRPEFREWAAGLWSAIREADGLPGTAVYLAGSKAVRERQRELALRLLHDPPTGSGQRPRQTGKGGRSTPARTGRRGLARGPRGAGGEKRPAPAASEPVGTESPGRLLFAVMHFTAESTELELSRSLAILQPRYPAIADAGLGDYFLFVFRRRLAETAAPDNLVAALPLLAGSHVLGVTEQLAESAWEKLLVLAEAGTDGVLGHVQAYLLADRAGVEKEYRQTGRKHPSAVPYLFREHFLINLFAWLLKFKGLEAYPLLQAQGWLKRHRPPSRPDRPRPVRPPRPGRPPPGREPAKQELHELIVEEIRLHAALAFGQWYRPRARRKSGEEYRDLAISLLDAPGADEWEFGYFLIRHTVASLHGDVAWVDPHFEAALERNRAKLAWLLKSFPVKIGYRRGPS